MKKIFIGIITIVICFALVGCGGSTIDTVSSNLNNSMDRLSTEINRINKIDNSDISINGEISHMNNGEISHMNNNDSLLKVNVSPEFAVPNFNRNTDTYGNFYDMRNLTMALTMA